MRTEETPMYKVLIVDDCKSDLRGMQSYIPWSELGCIVAATATNGLEGYNAALKCVPDIVITDISMPVKDGFEMTKLINEKLKNVFYIYMSCHQSFDYARLAIENRAFDYVLKPIKRESMVDAVKKAIGSIDKDKGNSEIIAQLKVQLEENKKVLRENHLANLLFGVEKEGNSFLDLDSEKNFRIGIAVIENVQTDSETVYLQRMFLKDCLSMVFADSFFLNFENDKLIMVIEDDDIFHSLEQTQNEFNETFGKTVSMYFNEIGTTSENMREQFRKILNIIKNNFFEKNGQIVVVDESFSMENDSETALDVPLIYDNITAFFKQNTSAEEFVDKYLPSECAINVAYLKSVAYSTVCSICIFLASQNYSLSDIFEDEMVVWKKLTYFNSIVNIRQWIINMMHAVNDFLLGEKVFEKSNVLVEQIKSFIDVNFHLVDALELSASNQNISLFHANVIFKRCTQMTIFEYLVEKRMSKAKKMLRGTDKKIYEIAKSVGYSSNTYFSTAFKKNVGVTPQQYRDGRG